MKGGNYKLQAMKEKSESNGFSPLEFDSENSCFKEQHFEDNSLLWGTSTSQNEIYGTWWSDLRGSFSYNGIHT